MGEPARFVHLIEQTGGGRNEHSRANQMANTFFGRGSIRRAELKGEALAARDEQVLSALKAGLTERQVADALGLSPHTVHSHVKAVYRRVGVKSRAQLLSLWMGEK